MEEKELRISTDKRPCADVLYQVSNTGRDLAVGIGQITGGLVVHHVPHAEHGHQDKDAKAREQTSPAL